MENKSFSGIIITYNEEDRISQCINSLNPFCSEILVVDSFSTDKTIELAKKLGAKVIQNEFNSHVKQKNFAIEKVKTKYCVVVCDDDFLIPVGAATCVDFLEKNSDFSAAFGQEAALYDCPPKILYDILEYKFNIKLIVCYIKSLSIN